MSVPSPSSSPSSSSLMLDNVGVPLVPEEPPVIISGWQDFLQQQVTGQSELDDGHIPSIPLAPYPYPAPHQATVGHIISPYSRPLTPDCTLHRRSSSNSMLDDATPYPAPVEHTISPYRRPPTPDSPFIPPLPSCIPVPPPCGYIPTIPSPVYQPSLISPKRYEEGEDHFVRRWQKWDQYGKMWVPDRYRSWSPTGIPGVGDYFYFHLNVRSMSQGGKFSLSDLSPILDSFLRTVFGNVYHDKPLEYPIHRLFQKMKVLRSRLDEACTYLDAEQLPEDLATKAEVFGFNASTGCEVAAEFVADLVIHLGKLLEVVEAESKQSAKQLEELLSNNQISFDLLEYYYEEGKSYIYNSGLLNNGLDVERPIILVVLKSTTRFLDEGGALLVEMEYFEWDGVRFEKRSLALDFLAFQGTRAISSLFLQPVTDEALAKVTGESSPPQFFVKMSNHQYRAWKTLSFLQQNYDDTPMRSAFSGNQTPRTRRVMIDPVGFNRASQGYNPHLRVPLPDNVEEYIARLPNWIGGYDLEMNRWRTFNIWDLKPVKFDQDAWSKLIMDEDTKDLLRALVDNTGCSVGGLKQAQFNKGQTVLLKGPPGTGRMTTVHAVCNFLKRPLLTITITASSLLYDHGNLMSDIALRVSLAATWNAVIVVKSADRLLESKNRELMNCIKAVLRQFESEDCISFWVSSDCGEELLTQFSTIVDFPELDAAARHRLWLGHFGLNDPVAICARALISSSVDQKEIDHSLLLRDIEKLSRHQLDGRMIDNIVRSARALAASNGEHLSIHHIKLVMKTQRLDGLSLWQKLTRILRRPAKVLHPSVVE
ncbi:hypothetical protein EDD22DRAFT_957927 [Suillus occidentalis]|nr:hypothetical protein EDD22DRAFT_957927 [Suillus occidentalis]